MTVPILSWLVAATTNKSFVKSSTMHLRFHKNNKKFHWYRIISIVTSEARLHFLELEIDNGLQFTVLWEGIDICNIMPSSWFVVVLVQIKYPVFI